MRSNICYRHSVPKSTLNVKLYKVPTAWCMCFEIESIMTLQGLPRSLILALIKSVHGTSYWSSIVTLVTACPVLEILGLLYAESHFFHISLPVVAKILGQFFWSRSMMLGSAESEHSRLTNREIIFKVFQPA